MKIRQRNKITIDKEIIESLLSTIRCLKQQVEIGIPVDPTTDVRFESSWYTSDTKKQVKEFESLSDEYTLGKLGQKYYLKEKVKKAVNELKDYIEPELKFVREIGTSSAKSTARLLNGILKKINKTFGKELTE